MQIGQHLQNTRNLGFRGLAKRLSVADETALGAVAGAGETVLDRTVLPATATADRSLIWLAAAAVLAAFGGRFGRRAALRGLLSIALSSGVTNGLVNLGVRRSRPPRRRLRLRPRPGGRTARPTTSAFPSGHTASAVAFAVGAGQEMPAALLPLGLAATAVGWSRVRSRLHYPADVVAGAVIGGGIALATRRLWPVAPRTPAQIRPALTSVDVDPTEGGAGVTIVVNPASGPALSRDPTAQLREALPEAEVIEIGVDADFDEALERALANAAVIGVAGGDGSINTVAAAAHRHDKPLMVVPSGTLNHLARDLGIEGVDDAVEAILTGSAVAVDLATVAGHPFLNTAAFGAYVDLVDARERLEQRLGKWPAVLVAMATVLHRGQAVEVEIDGQHRRVWLLFIGNCHYHPEGFTPSWRERLDDGQLDVRVVDNSHPFARSRLLAAVLTGRLGRSRVYDAWTTREVRIHSLQGPLRLASDGEVFQGPEDFVVAKSERPLRVYVARR